MAQDNTTATGELQARVRGRYEAAIALPSTAVEARIRFAWFLYRIGEFEKAVEQLRTAAEQPIQDTSLRYLHQLFSGYISWALNRQDEAIAHYRSARQTLPAAQSARVALMNALVLRGDAAAAEHLAQQVQIETDIEMDPWWMYWQGQYRLQPQAMARVRELSR
jgi:Tfp pilus assembly protein PilF